MQFAGFGKQQDGVNISNTDYLCINIVEFDAVNKGKLSNQLYLQPVKKSNHLPLVSASPKSRSGCTYISCYAVALWGLNQVFWAGM